MRNVESSMDWMSFSNKMKQVACQLSSSACPMVLVLPDGREVRFTDINVDTFDYKGKRGDTEYTSIGFKVNLLGAEVRNGKDDGSLASPPYGNCAKMREVVELLARRQLPPQEEYPAWYGGGKVPDKDGWLAWIRQAQSYAKFALAEPPRNCDRFGGDPKRLHDEWWEWSGKRENCNEDGTVKMTYGEWLLEKAKGATDGSN